MDKFWKMFGMFRPACAVFEDAAGGDANNANADGGDAGTKAAVGGDGNGAAAANAANAKKDDTFELTISGEKRSVTLDEMKTLAQKAAGAESKFQEASNLRKQAEDGLRFQNLMGRLSDKEHTPTDVELKEIAGMLGADPSEFANEFKNALGDDKQATTQDKQQSTAKPDKQAIIEALGFDPAEAKNILDYSHQRHIESARQEIRRISDEAVDKDEIFGKIKIGDGGDDRLATAKDMVAEDVLRRVQDGVPFGAELVAASVQKVRAYLTKFGTPNKLDQHPITLGLGPSNGLPAEIHSNTPIQRVSTADDGDGDNFVKRLAQRIINTRRSGNTIG